MKVGVAGKGGTGKSIVAGTLARLFARDGFRVLAVDVDPNTNLASTIGVAPDVAARIVPLAKNAGLAEERTGVSPGTGFGQVFKLNPKVDDIVEKFGVIGPDGVNLLVLGTIEQGGTGCFCPENALVRALIHHLILERKDLVIMDMEAGVEHLGRGTSKGVDIMLVMVEPGMKSIGVAERISTLAGDLGIGQVYMVLNKVRNEKEAEIARSKLHQLNLIVLAEIPFDPKIIEADMAGVAPIEYSSDCPAVQAIGKLKDKVESIISES